MNDGLLRRMLWLVCLGAPFKIACAYGEQARYLIDGTVIDKATRKPVAGIRCQCQGPGFFVGTKEEVTSRTNDAGAWNLDTSSITGKFQIEVYEAQRCEAIVCRDIDGKANGEYLDKSQPFTEPTGTEEADYRFPTVDVKIEMEQAP